MKRDVASLQGRTFDLLIIGAGIHGVAAAWAAARRGVSVALIDKGDIGEATSANSLKVIHGGLRYLQHLNFGRMRESIRARSRFLRMAPHLVVPRSFLMPTRGNGVRGAACMRAALWLNDRIAADRNEGLPPERRLPPGRVISRAELFSKIPPLDRPEFTGAALWYDGFAENTDRLNLAFAVTAAEAGAVVANYVKAERIVVENGAAAGVEATDVLSGTSFTIRAKRLVNAAGPWMNLPGSASPARTWVKAVNLIARRKWFAESGFALESASTFHDPDAVVQRGKRNLFFVPWRDGTMVGTLYSAFTDDPDRRGVSAEEIAGFVQEVNEMYPALKLLPEDVTHMHVGIMPARPGATAHAQPDKHSEIIDHAASGGPRGLISIKGVKYTTGLNVGEEAALRCIRELGGDAGPRPDQLAGGERLLTGAEFRAAAQRTGLTLTPEEAGRLVVQYGARHERLFALATGSDLLTAETLLAVREEMACKLADVALRRTDRGSFGCPPAEDLQRMAALMAGELGWDAARQAAEIAETRRLYYTARP